MKICKNCGFQNDDMSVYCSACGSLLDEKNTNSSPAPEEDFSQQDFSSGSQTYSGAQNNQYGAQQSAPYSNQYGYNPNMYAPMPVPNVTKGKVIAALIISILFGGYIGTIFAILALVAYGDYDSAVLRKDAQTAQEKCEKIKKYNKIAWIFIILGFVLVIGAAILFGALGIFAVSTGAASGIPTDFPEFGFDDFGIITEEIPLFINNTTSFLGF